MQGIVNPKSPGSSPGAEAILVIKVRALGTTNGFVLLVISSRSTDIETNVQQGSHLFLKEFDMIFRKEVHYVYR